MCRRFGITDRHADCLESDEIFRVVEKTVLDEGSI